MAATFDMGLLHKMLPAFLFFLFLFLLYLLLSSPNLDSRKECSDQILKALKSENYHMIGLYGNKGSGKSKLLKSKLGEYKKNFSRVFHFKFPSVSNNQDIKSIHEEIANKLDVHFERHHNDAARASMIKSKLESMDGTTLVILDGFPTTCRPRKLGIPYRRKGCKVFLTARNKEDCTSMGCDRSILLKPLYTLEAFDLLRNLAGFHQLSPMFNVAQNIASKCNGSPGLIKDVVSSLRNKPIENWKETLDSLRHSTARYQIFLSFRGVDTRDNFTKPLYQSLCSKGFETFIDDESLEGGAPIERLLDDIEESRSAIVILSENYADSKWCLKELVKILDCQKRKKQLVLPIFYAVGVEPKDIIGKLKEKYREAMAENNFGKDSQEWKQALIDIFELSGKSYEGPQDEFIEKIVDFFCEQRHRLHLQTMYGN